MIKLQIVGNLGKDCSVKEVNGKNVINFNVAHSDKFKDAQGMLKERTTWVECAYWTDKTAVAPYLKRGTTVYAEGFPEVDAYLNKDNQAAATLKMRVMNLQLVGGRPEGSQQGGYQTGQQAQPAMAGATSNGNPSSSDISEAADDLPF